MGTRGTTGADQKTATPPRRGRLAVVAGLVPPGSRVADVGTDHGRLPRLLLARGLARSCLATDVRALARTVPERWQGRLEVRRGPGLAVLRPEDAIDVVVIAGLGARSIVRILDDERRTGLGVRRWVLQPQRDVALLRRWLAVAGLGIVDERLALERGRVYAVLAVEPGAVGPDAPPGLEPEDVHEAGPILLRSADPLVRRLWTAERDRVRRLAARPGAGAGTRRRLERVERILAALPEPRRAR